MSIWITRNLYRSNTIINTIVMVMVRIIVVLLSRGQWWYNLWWEYKWFQTDVSIALIDTIKQIYLKKIIVTANGI